MHIAIIGLGRVGSTLALCVAKQSSFSKLTLINRSKDKADGLRYDLMAAFPSFHDSIQSGVYSDAKNADIIIISAGAFGAPAGFSLWDANKQVIDEIFAEWKPKSSAKIVITSTPIDTAAKYVQEVSGLAHENVLGFGGQLDVNRLLFLLREAGYDEDTAYFVGEHGAGGIPIFNANIQDRQQFIDKTRSFFKLYLAAYGASTVGTAQELVVLINALSSIGKELCVSYYDQKHDLYVTWPCVVSKDGVVPSFLSLSVDEQEEFDALMRKRKV